MFRKIGKKNKLNEKIVSQLERAIRNKKIHPGEKTPTEKEMCEIFGVSRTVVREAIQKLDAKGLITIIKGSGIYVNEYTSDIATNSVNLFLDINLSQEYIKHLMEIRKLIEPPLAKKAALNHNAKNLQKMELCIENMKANQNFKYKKEKRFCEKFHNEILNAAGNPVALLILKPILKLMPKIRSMVYHDVNLARKNTIEYHKLLLEAIRNQNGDEALSIMEEHLKIKDQEKSYILSDND